MKIILAGSYPVGTKEKFQAALPLDSFEEIKEQKELEQVTDADCIILRVLKAPAGIIANNRNLKAIMRWGAGFDSVDIKAAGNQGVLVTNVPGANAYAVAELAVGMMISLGRSLKGYNENVQKGNWERGAFGKTVSLNKKTIGLIGGGNIGRQVASRVQSFGAKVQYYDMYRLEEKTEQEYHLTYVSLEELLKTSDFVSLHVPLTDNTYHMIGENELGLMKKGAFLINTARGGLVDENALLRALEKGKLGGAGLDGVEKENSEICRELSRRQDVLLTPHVGGSTSDLSDVMIPRLIEQIKQLEKCGNITETVNRQYLQTAG